MVLCAERRVSWDTEFGPLVKGYSITCGNDDSKQVVLYPLTRGLNSVSHETRRSANNTI